MFKKISTSLGLMSLFFMHTQNVQADDHGSDTQTLTLTVPSYANIFLNNEAKHLTLNLDFDHVTNLAPIDNSDTLLTYSTNGDSKITVSCTARPGLTLNMNVGTMATIAPDGPTGASSTGSTEGLPQVIFASGGTTNFTLINGIKRATGTAQVLYSGNVTSVFDITNPDFPITYTILGE